MTTLLGGWRGVQGPGKIPFARRGGREQNREMTADAGAPAPTAHQFRDNLPAQGRSQDFVQAGEGSKAG